MRTLAEGVEVDEAFAADLATLAGEAAVSGHRAFANAFMANSRLHRVKAIQWRAKLDALIELHGPLP
ncbi:hypothetical protein MKK63_16325 [Methylobacterium sp. J-088]|uniref:hypothetical protein n=1 Tax=Methylobacterium sp. J-088 TaxID=2836664 RepID=UPI001FBA011F|nr:hypothetical protein [Methylobacterium sp. J-088]MCJ2064268.1 hypothetical protein [Methylobacterium sp. J-088]